MIYFRRSPEIEKEFDTMNDWFLKKLEHASKFYQDELQTKTASKNQGA